MSIHWKKFAASVLILGAGVALSGCGSNAPQPYPVSGKIALAGADVKVLAGSHVEVSLVGQPTVRASGEIQADGAFRLESQASGAIVNGVREGKHQVRIILSDDDAALRRQATKAVASRFLDFKTSGLSIDVPNSGEITIAIASR